MSDWALVYLLSVMGGWAATLAIAGTMAMIVALVGGIIATHEKRARFATDAEKESAYWFLQRAPRIAKIGAAMVIVALFLPGRRDLIESYVMVQASKVATADNAQKAVDGAMKRIDALIERLGK